MTIPASGPISFSQIRNELVITGSVSMSQLLSDNYPWSNIPAAEQAYAITDFLGYNDYEELAPITVDYDTNNDKILIAGNMYDDDDYGGYVHMLVIGSVSGTSISYTPIQIAATETDFTYGTDSTVLYMPTNNKIVYLYNTYGSVHLKIGYLSSATAVTWNNTYQLDTSSSPTGSIPITADLIRHPTINNKFFVLYKRNTTTKIIPYTVDSSGVAVAGVTTTLSISYQNKPAWAWDVQNNRLVLVYINGTNLNAQVGQFTAGASDSANTITFSAAISLSTSLTTGGSFQKQNVNLVYASQEQVLVCSYSTNGVYPKTQVLTVDAANNSIQTGPVVTAPGSSSAPETNKLLYRADTNTLHQFYNAYHTSSTNCKFTAHRLAISTGPATERKITFLTTVQGPTVGAQCGAVCLDPDSSKVVVVTAKDWWQPVSAFLYNTQKPVSPTVFRNKSHYPLRNSATDPTSNYTFNNNEYNWRGNSAPSGYSFVANKGIYSDAPITNMAYMFFINSNFQDADVALWDVSSVTNMRQMFFSCTNFNTNISNWNVSNVTNMSNMFYGNYNFNQNIGNWNVSNVTNMSNMFNGCIAFNADIGSWNPSSVTDMMAMFSSCTVFNQNLNSWNTTSMTMDTVPSSFASNSGLAVRNYPIFGRNFTNATYYPLRNYAPANNNDYPYNNTYWAGKPTTFTYVPYVGIIVENGDKITNGNQMFYTNSNFNDPDISLWDMSNLTNMDGMFWGATNFNQNISSWNTSNVTIMQKAFYQCTNFNQNLSSWNTGSVTNMYGMFEDCTNFNQNCATWNVAGITGNNSGNFATNSALVTRHLPFFGQSFTNGTFRFYPLTNTSTDPTSTNWQTNFAPTYTWITNRGIIVANGVITNMSSMFAGPDPSNKSSFTHADFQHWNTLGTTNMNGLFANTTQNHNVSNWNTSNVTNLQGMFANNSAFNTNIGSWDTSSATDMSYMFLNASSFNQNLTGWCVTNFSSEPTMFAQGAALSTSNKPVWGTCP